MILYAQTYVAQICPRKREVALDHAAGMMRQKKRILCLCNYTQAKRALTRSKKSSASFAESFVLFRGSFLGKTVDE